MDSINEDVDPVPKIESLLAALAMTGQPAPATVPAAQPQVIAPKSQSIKKWLTNCTLTSFTLPHCKKNASANPLLNLESNDQLLR